jgi:phosphoglycolate phosphatase
MTPPTIVFDLDGTLIDTAPDLVGTLNVILAREGLPPVPYDKARTMVGGGARRMIEAGLAFEKRPATKADLDRMFNDFIAHYADHIAVLSRPFPGLDQALDRLQEQGCTLAVCTNKLEHLSRLLLDALDMSRRFKAICGQDTFGIQKPDPQVLQRTIAAAGGSPSRAVMIGDSATDIDTAKAAGIPVIAVDFGYTEIPVRKLGPDRVISHYSELTDAIAGLGQAPPRTG